MLHRTNHGGNRRLANPRFLTVAAILSAMAHIVVFHSQFFKRQAYNLPFAREMRLVLEGASSVVQLSGSSEKSLTPKIWPGDENCPFRDSPLYRRIFVYPNPDEPQWNGSILSNYAQLNPVPRFPWFKTLEWSRANGTSHFDIDGGHVQFTTELLIQEIMINPSSCVRTYDPEQATLFYVPYLPSVEYHRGQPYANIRDQTKHAKAIQDIIENQNYKGWETIFGLTSRYWKRNGGRDHILVFSEVFHGLQHPTGKAGHYHFIHTQKQLDAPIVVSVELSQAFVAQYPQCSRKNILLPYPNTDGRFYNGAHARTVTSLLQERSLTAHNGPAAMLSAELEARALVEGNVSARSMAPRPMAQYYQAGVHGPCDHLRQALRTDYACTPSRKILRHVQATSYQHGMLLSTFCPCPHGDSPGAKRMYDAILSGCIPVILSTDFVWPFTNEYDATLQLDPSAFSIRINSTDFYTATLKPSTCRPIDDNRPSLQSILERIPAAEIARLRRGVAEMQHLYGWYQFRPDLPDNPLQARVLPDGGAAHRLVEELALRADESRWPACAHEVATQPADRAEVDGFVC